MRKTLIALAVAGLILSLAQPQAGAFTIFEMTMDGAQAGFPESTGTGWGTFVLSADETSLSYEIHFSDLLAPETVSHFHIGAVGVSGPVVKNLPLGSPKIGVWAAADATQPLTAERVQQLKDHLFYINVHSSYAPGGEIRGQIVPEPASMAVLATGVAGLLGLKRRKMK